MKQLLMLVPVLLALSACRYFVTQNSAPSVADRNAHTQECGASVDAFCNQPTRCLVSPNELPSGTKATCSDGQPGVPGREGRDGVPGRDGKDGLPGRDGQAGPLARDGRDGMPGRDGRDGLPGRDGQPGASGSNCVDVIYPPVPPTSLMLFLGHSVGGKPSEHPILDFCTAMLTGLAAVATAFSPLLLFWLEKGKKDKSFGWGWATLLELLVIVLACYLFCRLVYFLASAIFVVLGGFILCSSVLMVAAAYAYKSIKEIELRERQITLDEKRFEHDRKPVNT